ncbi:MAG: cation diffusion facilitator family transporter [Candidatus Omnitrophica bacterium]|nr:cation diffusion facilitator family transporter [Candidatus Omnitrophota bacterium]
MDGISAETHYKKIRQVLLWILVLNWAVACAKLIYGILSHCVSMTADGFHSFSDGTSNIVGLIGIFLACQPKDKEHPYGHKKYETFFSLGIAALLFLVAFELVQQGIQRFSKPLIPTIDIGNFIVMAATLMINILVMRYEFKIGREFKSDILISDSMHTKADILTSLSVIVTMAAIKLGVSSVLDPIVTIMIALFIAHEAFEIARQSSRVLCDEAAILDDQKIADIVLGVKGVRTCHKIRSRGRPDDIYIDLHVQVAPDMHVDRAHAVSYAIEEAIKKNIPEVTDVVVHVEPKEKTPSKP